MTDEGEPRDPEAAKEAGREARKARPRSSLAQLDLAPGRDPVALTSYEDVGRLDWLLAERYRRMSTSAFTFYRGTAAIMAFDLGGMPSSGIITQLCGDAHMSNFGLFASPERDLLFDVNDFDETSRGPFEWDVQRLAASAVLAARDASLTPAMQRRIASAASAGYQSSLRILARRGELDVWYERVSTDRILDLAISAAGRKRVEQALAKARRRDAASAVAKLTEVVDGRLQLRDDPPLQVRLTELTDAGVRESLADYRATLPDDRQLLLDRFTVVDVAHKVVGVGSVGTRCMAVLLQGRDHCEPLILQFKEAEASVLEPYVEPSAYLHQGERVVAGQRLMQSASDIFLGWTTNAAGSDFYWRQIRDMKWSPELSTLTPRGLVAYAGLCGAVLARAHARSGSRAEIAAYIGSGPRFVDAMTDFAVAYADRAELDYELMKDALADGRLPTVDAPFHAPSVRGGERF